MDKGVTAVAFGREARQVPLAFASFHSLALVATGTRRAVRVAASASERVAGFGWRVHGPSR